MEWRMFLVTVPSRILAGKWTKLLKLTTIPEHNHNLYWRIFKRSPKWVFFWRQLERLNFWFVPYEVVHRKTSTLCITERFCQTPKFIFLRGHQTSKLLKSKGYVGPLRNLKFPIPPTEKVLKTCLDLRLMKVQPRYGTNSTGTGEFLKEKRFEPGVIGTGSRRKVQDSYEENDEMHHCPRSRHIAKTTPQPRSILHWKILLKSDSWSMASLDGSKYNAIQKEISMLKRG